MGKGKAFLIGLGVICFFGVLVFFVEGYPASMFLTATVTLTTGYFAIQVADNGVKGKFWNHDMYHHERGEEPDRRGGKADGQK